MAVGTLQPSTAVVAAGFISAMLLYLRLTEFGSRQDFDVIVNLCCIGEPLLQLNSVSPILSRHALRAELATTRRLDVDRVDVSYRVLLRDPQRANDLQSELESADGVEHVSVFIREDESEI
jgi:hypothetical protein